jgi:thiol-disulfide isomerase/thioredoxin
MRFRLSVLAASLLMASPALAMFNDSKGHPYEDAIQYVLDNGIVSGYPDRTYRPEQVINRAEFTKIVMGARFASEIDACALSTLTFPDVPKDSWFAKYVCVAKAKGIVGGYPDGTFKPDRNVNAAEAAKIVTAAYGVAPAQAGTAVWYQPYVDVLKQKTAYPPTVSNVSAGLTRGEMAYIIHRMGGYAEVPSTGGGCKVAGCSSQLCVDEEEDGISTCEWRAEYACYQNAECERQGNGQCGWTMTDDLAECLEGDRDDTAGLGEYEPYAPAAADAQTKPYVLFFHAEWCPYCQKNDSYLEDFYGEGRAGAYTVYKLNYDTANDMRSAYNVTTQDTFILLDADGNEIERVSFPSQVQLEALITIE